MRKEQEKRDKEKTAKGSEKPKENKSVSIVIFWDTLIDTFIVTTTTFQTKEGQKGKKDNDNRKSEERSNRKSEERSKEKTVSDVITVCWDTAENTRFWCNDNIKFQSRETEKEEQLEREKRDREIRKVEKEVLFSSTVT